MYFCRNFHKYQERIINKDNKQLFIRNLKRMQERPFKIFSGSKSRYFAEKVCNSLKCPLGNMIIEHFADGEFAVSYEESIRGKQVFLIQSPFPARIT